MRLVVAEIVWIDAADLQGWTEDPAAVLGETRIHTVGLLVHEDKDCVIVSSSAQIGTDSWCSPLRIPRSTIVRMRTFSTRWT